MLSLVQGAALPTAPRRFGFGTYYTDWGALGNDQVGDCVVAGAAHETMVWNKVVGHPVTFTDDDVINDYSAVTGYVRGNPATDRGTDVSQMMDYRRTVGVRAADGSRHRIELAVRAPIGDWTTFTSCVYTFGAVGVGFRVTDDCIREFRAGKAWTDTGNRWYEGGHYGVAVGSLGSSYEISLISWGRRQRATRGWFEAYVDELWVPLSRDVLRGTAGLHRVDWSRVEELAAGLLR